MNKKTSEKKITDNISILYHELMTPLNLMASTAKLSRDKLEKGIIGSSEMKEYLDRIVNNSKKLTLILGNILDLDGIFLSNKEFVNSNQFFDAFIKSLNPFCIETGVNLKSEFNAKREFIYIPVLTTERILLNLVTNAIKYNDKGKKNITIKIYDDEKNLFFSVKDNGMGISKENIKNITKEFFRVDPNTTKGLGIGLSLVEKCLEYMNGTMTVKSQLKKGTEFIISIPVPDEKDLFIANETDYVYRPEKSSFEIEFSQLKNYDESQL